MLLNNKQKYFDIMSYHLCCMKKIYKLQFLFRRFEIQEKRNYKQLYAENGKINNNLYLKFLNNY